MSAPVPRTVRVEEAVLGHNRELAARLRSRFEERGTLVVNVLSSPGSGKTSLLERTLAELTPTLSCAVIAGDLATDNDARRLAGHGAPVVQIATADICHLDASMIERALPEVDSPTLQLLFIENVGNLVCPASYDLGEGMRAVLLSVTEGEDKPLKYPTLFKTADIAVVTKIDIAEPVGFDRATALANIRSIAPQARILEVSARTGEGLSAWFDELRGRVAALKRP